METIVFLIGAGLVYSTPVVLAGLGGLWSLEAGDLNIALEGQMLAGAFASVAGAYFLGSWWLGLLSGVLVGALLGALFGALVVYLRGDVFIVGITFNLLISALTVFLLGLVFDVRGSFSDPRLEGIPKLPLGPLGNSDLVAEALGKQTIVLPVMLCLVLLSKVLISRSALGTRVRAIGEHREAALTAGINVPRARMTVQVVVGCLCGLAGAQLSLGGLTLFSADMSAGMGFVAVAAALMAGRRPLVLLLAAVAFGTLDAFSVRIQDSFFPTQLLQTLPYVAAMAALVIAAVARRQSHSLTAG